MFCARLNAGLESRVFKFGEVSCFERLERGFMLRRGDQRGSQNVAGRASGSGLSRQPLSPEALGGTRVKLSILWISVRKCGHGCCIGRQLGG